MNTEMLGIVAMFTIALLLSLPLGKYMAKVYSNERTFLDPLLNPLERFIFRMSGINPEVEQTWKQQLSALLTINMVWFLLGMLILMNQGWLPLNPDQNPSMSPHLAFNTTISFVVNCNLQHYSGESGLSYLGQLFLMFLQFVSAATGMAAAVSIFYALRKGTYTTLGNYYQFFLKSCTRILVPICLVIATIFLFNGMPMTMAGKSEQISLQGDTTQVSTGPVAAFIPMGEVFLELTPPIPLKTPIISPIWWK
jgi:K+-transporting ATPase ATPase A chain